MVVHLSWFCQIWCFETRVPQYCLGLLLEFHLMHVAVVLSLVQASSSVLLEPLPVMIEDGKNLWSCPPTSCRDCENRSGERFWLVC